MKKIFLVPVLALAFGSCSTKNTENTTVNGTDTILTTTPSTTTTSSITTTEIAPADNTNGGISTGESDASMKGTGSGATAPASGSNAQTTAGTPNVAAPTRSDVSNPQSTYDRAQPGDTVNARTNMGSSR